MITITADNDKKKKSRILKLSKQAATTIYDCDTEKPLSEFHDSSKFVTFQWRIQRSRDPWPWL
jgi:hypothetical protein